MNETWKVSYVHLEDRMMRRPFFKKTSLVAAESRAGAIARVQGYVSSAHGEFRASKAPGAKPDVFFQ